MSQEYEPLCGFCDYPLRDLSESRCPECGEPFDLYDDSSYNPTGRPIPRIARWIAGPLGFFIPLISLLAFPWALWVLREPGSFEGMLLAGLLWIIVAVLFVLRVIGAVIFARSVHVPRKAVRQGAWKWAIVPVILLVWLAVPRDAVVRAAFRFSKPALEKIAEQARRDLAGASSVRRAGLFNVREVEIDPSDDAVRIHTNFGYDGNYEGFALRAKPLPPSWTADDLIRYDELDGDWRTFWKSRWITPPATAPAPTPTSQPLPRRRRASRTIALCCAIG
jgi:hypothetical protein